MSQIILSVIEKQVKTEETFRNIIIHIIYTESSRDTFASKNA